MASDKARISYDEHREYRGVVNQQGRVTLEADSNEDRAIASELLREETIDIVGPCGTPDDGYKVIAQVPPAGRPAHDVEVGPGTMYVGGERVVLYDDVWYSEQSEWLDFEGDPDWVVPDEKFRRGLVYLYLEEHEVGAVEDKALLEVALGGPDTAQRLRLLQRIRLLETGATTCEDAMQDAVEHWSEEGLWRDPADQRLVSNATLEVVYEDTGTSGDLCEPAAQGGYLDPDNQLIRVQLAAAADDGAPTFLWGYDNASFLYRVDVAQDLTTLTLDRAPVDAAHNPTTKNVVEVIRTAARLETGSEYGPVETSPDDFVAALTGEVRHLQTGYDPTTKQVVLDAALPAEYGGSSTPIFLRVWNEQIAFARGAATELGTTGVSVVIDTNGGGPFHLGDFWQIGVRPEAPTTVYPARYLDEPQPPAGPRLWATPLAVVEWDEKEGLTVLEDCRDPFDNLVDLTKRKQGGCCDIVVRPEDLKKTTLQAIVDQFAGTPANICLAPGHYPLKRPLRLGKEHSRLTIEACHRHATLVAEHGEEKAFLQGLVVLERADDVTLSGITFELPNVEFGQGLQSTGGLSHVQVTGRLKQQLERFVVSIGVRPVDCARLTLVDCLFRFKPPADADIFAAAIFAASETDGLDIHNCSFFNDKGLLESRDRLSRVLIGYLIAPTLVDQRQLGARRPENPQRLIVPTLLDGATFRDNRFYGLSFAAFVAADCGLVRVEDNLVRHGEFGFVFFGLRALAFATYTAKDQAVFTEVGEAGQSAYVPLEAVANDRSVALTNTVASSFPLPTKEAPASSVEVPAEEPPPEELLGPVRRTVGRIGERPPDMVEFAPRSATGIGSTKREFAPVADANAEFMAFSRLALWEEKQTAKGIDLTLHVTENDIDLELDIPAGPGLLVWDTDRKNDSALTVTGNRIAVRSESFPAILGLLVDRCAAAGNVIVNTEGSESPAVAVLGGEASFAGNVIGGRYFLPANPTPQPGADAWAALNAIG
jgi:hypothetical protein